MNKVGIIGVIVGVVGVAYGAYMACVANKISKKLDKTIDELSNSDDIEITDEMINKAVFKAADDRSSEAMKTATKNIVGIIEQAMLTNVREAVESQYDNISEEITEKVSKEINDLDMDKLRRDIERRASDIAARKFDNNLDNLLDKFNCDLDNVSRIYRSISNTMANTSNTINTLSRFGVNII